MDRILASSARVCQEEPSAVVHGLAGLPSAKAGPIGWSQWGWVCDGEDDSLERTGP